VGKAVVSIGVDRTGSAELRPLKGAASGAAKFAQWAEKQGYAATLLTDTDEGSVTLNGIKKAVAHILRPQTCECLIVYFAGHGILKAPDQELWLLSDAPGDPNAAVDVFSSRWLARNHAVPHVVFISDACRSRPVSAPLSQMIGGAVFPNQATLKRRPAVDVFYATLPGDPAMEVPVDEAILRYDGIFTEKLLEALRGKVPGVLEDWSGGVGDKRIIPAWTLKTYLETAVPEAIGDIDIRLEQYPEIRVESHKPAYLAEVVVTNESIAPPLIETVAPLRTAALNLERSHFKGILDTQVLDQPEPDNGMLRLAIQKLAETQGRESFETATGFTIVGSPVASALMPGHMGDVFQENGQFQVRTPHEARSLLIRFTPGGAGTCLAVLPGFIGTVVVEEGRVVSVSYFPARSNPRFAEYHRLEKTIRQKHAFVAASARLGVFALQEEYAGEMGSLLRVEKALDPTLGLYAAYAYAQVGQFDQIESVFEYMSQEPEPVLFDVAMLAAKLSPDTFIVPGTPLLTQGWALLETLGLPMPAYLLQAQHELLPSLWTTLTAEGMTILERAMQEGQLV
jgi:hypothetical protein